MKAFLLKVWRSGVGPVIGLVLFLFALAFVVAGCKPAAQPEKFPDYCYDDDAFTARVVQCALTAPTREASHACRAEVLGSCGITETVSQRSVAP